MRYLAIVSAIWAFSFGLIGNTLNGIDPFFIATARLAIASLLFLPFLRFSAMPSGCHLKLIACGGLQFGLMSVCYLKAFQYIPSHLVALFSILTPVYVILVHELRERRFNSRLLYPPLLSVLGAAIINGQASPAGSIWTGFLLMQIAGLFFAIGQVGYRGWKRRHPETKDHQVFALLLIGGFLIAAPASGYFSDWSAVRLESQQLAVLVYLGSIASGLGFFLWNKGAALTHPSTLAVFNNAVVPLAMAASLFIFGEVADLSAAALGRLLLGAACIGGAILFAEKMQFKN